MKRVLFNTIFLALLLAPALAEAIPAFPGAEGHGAESVGGRGGAAIEVTNLNDSDAGSFRACLEAFGPRTCVFRVGGTITLESPIFIREPYLTIAGQTAPGGGIQLRGHGIYISPPAHDVIVRYIRHRRGWVANSAATQSAVGFEISSRSSAFSPSSEEVYNVIVDHSSFGWQQDDNGTWGKVRNVTYQWNIFAEGNNGELESKPGGKGLLVGAPPEQGGDMGAISIHHNYLVSNYLRNPLITGDGPTEFVNNVMYNWGSFGSQVQNRGAGTAVNLIGNFYKPGPNTSTSRYEVLISASSTNIREQLPQMMYMQDNLGPHRTSSAQAEWALVAYCGTGPTYCTVPASTSFQKSSPWPSSAHPITVSPAQSNVAHVLSSVGAILPARDALDTRLVAEYHAGTGSLGGDNQWPVLATGTPPTDTDYDGMPDQWETSKGLNPSDAADGNIISPSYGGYTNLEVYLADIAAG